MSVGRLNTESDLTRFIERLLSERKGLVKATHLLGVPDIPGIAATAQPSGTSNNGNWVTAIATFTPTTDTHNVKLTMGGYCTAAGAKNFEARIVRNSDSAVIATASVWFYFNATSQHHVLPTVLFGNVSLTNVAHKIEVRAIGASTYLNTDDWVSLFT